MNEIEILRNAPEDVSEAEYKAYLDEACGGDHDLRLKVEELLEFDRKAAAFMDQPVVEEEVAQGRLHLPDEAPGLVIGHYKLLQKIGEGGFGDVYMADQLAPVKRRVALKIIKLGMDTRQVIARFEVERQALAMMDHPNIAKVYDAGATETGRPYFVMELVRGLQINRFCEERQLNTKSRLKLFIDVCSAIQHAHQKGIIHRDLKPSNVIVTLHDDKAVAKVIDFGVAKATQQDLTDKTLFTQFEQFIGTPAYMSPEQAQLSGLDIDTRSDIYSLGVLLYELLTGTTPFDSKTIARAPQEEIRRMIREEEPPKPSTRLTALQKRTAADSDVSVQNSEIDQDLDWIVMKALEKDRTRRYETANGLAADVRRHLDDEPVEAGPPGFSYRFGKLLRRHRAAVLTTAAMAVLLACGGTVSTWLWLKARATAIELEVQRDRAVKEEVRALKEERTAAHRVAEELFEANKPDLGIIHLAKLLRADPTNHVAAERLMFALRQRIIPRSASPSLPSVFLHGRFLALSKSETYVAAASEDLTQVSFYNVHSGKAEGPTIDLAGMRFKQAEFSPDENLILIASSSDSGDEAQAQIWNWRLHKKIGMPSLHGRAATITRFSPDGDLALAADLSGFVRVWETHGDWRLEVKKDSGHIWSADFSPDGQWVVTGGRSGIVRIWEARTGNEIVSPLEHGSPVRTVRFDASGTRVVTGTEDGIGRIWDCRTGELLGSPMMHGDEVRSVEFSPEGRAVLTGSWDGTARLWSASSGKPLGSPMQHARPIVSAHFSNRGGQIVTATDQACRIWSVSKSVPIGVKFGHPLIRHATFDANGDRVLVSTEGSPSRIWEARPGQPLSQIFRHYWHSASGRVPDNVNTARFSVDGSRIVTAGSDGTSRIWEGKSGKELKRNVLGQKVVHAVLNADDTLAVSSSMYGAHIWSPANGERLHQLRRGEISMAIFSPAKDALGRWRVATTSTGENAAVQIWDAETGNQIGPDLKLSPGQGIPAFGLHGLLAFSRDGDRIAAVTGDNTAKVWEVAGEPDSWELLCHLKGDPESPAHVKPVWSVSFSPDGTRVLTGSLDGTARVWDVTTGKQLCPALVHSKMIVNACFSPDGSLIGTASNDSAQVWDAATGKPQGLALRHTAAHNAIAFSPDSRRVATGGLDGTARVWDAQSGFPISEVLRHDAWVQDISFSPDGRQLLTAGEDGTARLWDVPPAPEGQAPAWVWQWAEALVGLRIDNQGTVVEIGWEQQQKLEEEARSHAGDDDFYGRTVKWYYEVPATRTITPFNELTVGDYIENRLNETNRAGFYREDSLEEVLRIAPNNIEALAKLAKVILESKRTDKVMDLRRARYFAGLATAAEPGRAEYTELLNRIERELATVEEAPAVWNRLPIENR